MARRMLKELGYAALNLPLGALGFGYLVIAVVSGALTVTVLGLPVLAAVVLGARGWGAMHRRLARAVLGVEVADPGPPVARKGWIRTGLGDGTGWRALAYLALKFPLSLVAGVLGLGFWGYGLSLISYPIWFRLIPPSVDGRSGKHAGMVLGSFFFDTWPRAAVVAATGVVVLLLAPWVVRLALWPDRLLIRPLLGRDGRDERVADLEHSRAYAVDESAAALRRIERDLHDGAQARLVAVAMKLGMAREKLGEDVDPATRELLDAAHQNAKEAIGELRDLARGIHPPALDGGLDAALATLAARSPVPVLLQIKVPERPSPAIESIAYFCVAELLTNVAKHSHARQATVTVTQRPHRMTIRVGDDGTGGAGYGAGLVGLRERVRTVDGKMAIESPPGGPTMILVDLPIRHE